MPIEFLSNRQRAQRLGRVRLGTKKTSDKTGKPYPVATPYFVLNDAPGLKEIYDEQPTRLNIEFLSENLEFTFPHYMRRYTAAGLRCLGDGQKVLYRVNKQGTDVRDGNAIKPDGKVVMDEHNQPVNVPCPGDQCPFYLNGDCKPTGFLRFLPIEAPRLGYYDLVCHQLAVVGIKTQLALTREIFHHITGIPFILHRGEEEQIPVPVPGKGVVAMPVRTQWIEIDPDWFAENFPLRDKHRALSAARIHQDIIDLFGEDSNGDEPLKLTAGDVFAEPTFDGEKEASKVLVEASSEMILAGGLEIEFVKRDVDAIKTLGDLWTACLEDFGLNRTQAIQELGVTSQEHLAEEPRNLYRQIAAVRKYTKKEEQ